MDTKKKVRGADMENTNEMIIEFDSRSCNESFARVTVAAFCTQLNPTLEEMTDIKTAVSEAITNAIVHGYEGEIHKIRIECRIRDNEMEVGIIDRGRGIENVKKAMEPLFTFYGGIYGRGNCGFCTGTGDEGVDEKKNKQ